MRRAIDLLKRLAAAGLSRHARPGKHGKPRENA